MITYNVASMISVEEENTSIIAKTKNTNERFLLAFAYTLDSDIKHLTFTAVLMIIKILFYGK